MMKFAIIAFGLFLTLGACGTSQDAAQTDSKKTESKQVEAKKFPERKSNSVSPNKKK